MKELGLREQPNTIRELVMLGNVAEAVKGNPALFKEFIEREDGKVGLSLEEDEEAVSFIFKVKKDTTGKAAKNKKRAEAMLKKTKKKKG